MTAKRFISEDNCCGYYTEIIDNEKELDLSIPNPKKNLTIDELVALLNELHKENQSLKKKLEFFYELNKPYGIIIEENKQLKAQLHCDDEEGVCNICKHHYLEKGKTYEKYYISKCKKGHEECSKMDLKYCDDFELKEGDV